MSLKIGSSKSSQSSSSRPLFTNTGYSSISGNTIRLDPSIRAMQDDAIQRYAASYGDIGQATDRFLTQSSDLRGRYAGNAGNYIAARTNPVTQRFATLRGQVQQDMGRRGIGGSTFGYNTLRDIDTQAAQTEGDARALATNELAQFENQLNTQELQALNQKALARAQLTGETLEVARMRLAQEMGLFGLGTQTNSSGRSTSIGADIPIAPKGFSLFG